MKISCSSQIQLSKSSAGLWVLIQVTFKEKCPILSKKIFLGLWNRVEPARNWLQKILVSKKTISTSLFYFGHFVAGKIFKNMKAMFLTDSQITLHCKNLDMIAISTKTTNYQARMKSSLQSLRKNLIWIAMHLNTSFLMRVDSCDILWISEDYEIQNTTNIYTLFYILKIYYNIISWLYLIVHVVFYFFVFDVVWNTNYLRCHKVPGDDQFLGSIWAQPMTWPVSGRPLLWPQWPLVVLTGGEYWFVFYPHWYRHCETVDL